MPKTAKTYKVGYKKPPRAHQFKPGQSGNPKGRPKVYKSLINVLEEAITMRVGGKSRKVSPFEAAFRKTAQNALEGRLSAIKRFFTTCDDVNLLAGPASQAMSGVWVADYDPANYPWHDFTEAEFAELDRLNKLRDEQMFASKEPMSDREAVIRRVALERHPVPGQRNRMTVLELVQLRLRQRAFKDGDEACLA